MGDITVKEMIKSAKQNLDEVSVADVKKKLNSSKTNIIDLRDTAELIENGVIPGSHHASRGHLEFFADPKCEYYKDCFNKEKEIILFCNSGARSALAAYTLKTMGYKNVSHMKGGFKAWMKEIGVIEDFS
ncbi:MAG: rhodanese-like domain-containing protein [Gammaproteobacteria bacterium]|mgnify:FL=1|jgi:rhodanese-related sulfurtransferase|nr:rhodanese-like domain-containing protein [Gammaproteobacteria bacterium]MBT7603334.1 rhodanese-like domain-containing protein [Gammaproteobacteria bacterium]